jgi:hypothetical protein
MQPVLRAGQLLVYWLLICAFAMMALVEKNDERGDRSPLMLALGGSVLAVIIGLRYEVGGDWHAYERMLAYARFATLTESLGEGDPAYQFLNWTAQRLGAGIWLVNLVCGIIFSWGLVRFARTQANPWAVMRVAIPYLVIVVAMGYARQGVAIGILMAGLASLLRGASIPKFALYILVAALFHKTAIVALLLVLVSARRNLFLNVLFVLVALVVLYDVLVADSVDKLVRNYIEQRYNSQGALIRVSMSIIPAIIFLAARRHFGFRPDEDILWRNFSYAALILALLLAVLPSSTLVDRLALYVLPLQLVIIARIPDHVLKSSYARILVVAYAFAIQFVWLNYATNASGWVPFQFHPLST